MVIKIHKSFLKDIQSVPSRERKRIESFVFHDLPGYHSLIEIPKIQKLSGYKNYFKIRFGDYRLGIRLSDNVLYIERILHRREIYRYFP